MWVFWSYTASRGRQEACAIWLNSMPIKVSLSLCQDLLVTVQLQKDLEKRKYQEWIEDVEKAYQWLKERTSKRFVTGLSMGGTLTLYMGEKHKDIAGLITINAAVQMPNETSMLILGSLGIPRFAKGVGSDIKKGIKEPAYELTPIRATKQLALLLRLVRNNIKDVDQPILIFSSKEDHVVPPENQRWIYENVSSTDQRTCNIGEQLPCSYPWITI